MGQDVQINLGAQDNVSPKLKRIKGEVDGLRRSAEGANRAMSFEHKMGSMAGRLGGGAGGGVMSRALGGFNGGVGMGLIGMSIAAVGLGIKSLFDLSARAVEDAIARVKGAQAQAKTEKEAGKADRAFALGGLSFADVAKRYLSAGGNTADIGQRARSSGTSVSDQMAAELKAQALRPGLNQEQAIKDSAILLATGVVSTLEEGVAVAAKYQRRPNGLRFAYLAQRGMAATEENQAIAAQAILTAQDSVDGLSRNPRNAEHRNIIRSGYADTKADQARLDALTSGKTADATWDKVREEMNPGQQILSAAVEEAQNSADAMKEAAQAQNKLVAVIKSLGGLLGGEGSEKQKLDRFMRNAPVGVE